MKQILVPVDFSTNSRIAAAYACTLAQKTGTAIILFHAIEPVADNLRQPFSLHDKYLEQVMNDRLNELSCLKYELQSSFPEIFIDHFAQHGPASITISEFIKKTSPKLVVMGKKGRTALEKILIGSVSKGVISRSIVPVIIVPQDYAPSAIKSITIATNHFEKDSRYLTPIIELANIFGASIHVVVFIDTDTALGYDYSDMSFRLQSYAQFLKKEFPQIDFTSELLEGSDFGHTIEEYDEKIHAGMLGLFSYPKNTWEKIINKSMAKKMASKSKIPMLVVPVKDDAELFS